MLDVCVIYFEFNGVREADFRFLFCFLIALKSYKCTIEGHLYDYYMTKNLSFILLYATFFLLICELQTEFNRCT